MGHGILMGQETRSLHKMTTFQDTEPKNDLTTKIWIDTNAADSKNIVIPEIRDDEISGDDTWSSNKIQNTLDEIQLVTGAYVVIRGTDVAKTVESGEYHQVNLDTIMKTSNEKVKDYVKLTDDGLVLVQPGTYLISGKVQITSSTLPINVYARWLISGDGKTFTTSPETQNAEAYQYIGAGESRQAKVSLTETTITLTESKYVKLDFNVSEFTKDEDNKIVFSPEACRLQITKLK